MPTSSVAAARRPASSRARAVLVRLAGLGLAALVAAGCLPVAQGPAGTAGAGGATPSSAAPAATTAPSRQPGGGSDGPPPPATAAPTTGPDGEGQGQGPSPSRAPALPTARRVPAVPRAALDRRLDVLRTRLGIPGVAVAIRWDDGRVWVGSSGLADVGARRPVTSTTAFSVGSVSKTFTAAAVLRLVEQGRIALSARAVDLLPDLGIDLDPAITVRMLLDHTSGLTDFFFHPKIDRLLAAAPDATWTAARTLRYLPKGSAAPGTTYHYSNTNFLLLGLIVERVTGRPLAVVVRSLLLDPVGLDDTWTQVAERPLLPLARGYRLLGAGAKLVPKAVAPRSDVAPYRSVVSAAGGAGGIAGTASDMATWISALARGEVVRPQTLAAMTTPTFTSRDPLAPIPYGLGLQLVRLGPWDAIGHSGRYAGFRAVVRYLPEEHLSIAVLTNQSALDPARVARSLLALVAVPRPQCTGCPTDR